MDKKEEAYQAFENVRTKKIKEAQEEADRIIFDARANSAKSGLFIPHFGNRKLTGELTVPSCCFGCPENLNQVVISLVTKNNQDFIPSYLYYFLSILTIYSNCF